MCFFLGTPTPHDQGSPTRDRYPLFQLNKYIYFFFDLTYFDFFLFLHLFDFALLLAAIVAVVIIAAADKSGLHLGTLNLEITTDRFMDLITLYVARVWTPSK